MGTDGSSPGCGIDTVEISRIEKLLKDHGLEELGDFFTAQELSDAGAKSGRAASLAARFAAKEACCKLFPKETTLGKIEPTDFGVVRDGYGAPQVEPNARAREVMDRYRVAGINLSLTHTGDAASAVALAEWKKMKVPWYGKWNYLLFPWRRQVVLGNLGKVFGDVVPEEEIVRIAQASYGHFIKFFLEFLRMPFLSAKRKKELVRIEGVEILLRALEKGKGVLLLSGHFGNWEVATVAAIRQFEDDKGKFYFVRRPVRPALLDAFIRARSRRAGLETLGKKGSLDEMLEVLERNQFVLFVYDQHSGGKHGVPVDFFGHEAQTMKSLPIIAQSTGAPVIPASAWREEDGSHVMLFEEPLEVVDLENVGEATRRNARTFNAALERIIVRHPEQWIWMHKRWKPRKRRRKK